MKKKFSFKSLYLFPFMALIMFLLIFIMLYQMRYSITNFVMEQVSTDNETITREKAVLFSSLLTNMRDEAKGILEYADFAFSVFPDNEYDAREALNRYFHNTRSEKLIYIMKTGQAYDHDARRIRNFDANISNLFDSEGITVSNPFYDASSKSELIIVYIPLHEADSMLDAIIVYYKVTGLYTIGEFFESDKGSYYVVDGSGNSIFSKDKGISTRSLISSYQFPQDEGDRILAFMASRGNTYTVVSSYDNAVMSVSSIQNTSGWYVMSLLPSSVISEKTVQVIEQSILISAIIMGVFIIFLIIFFSVDTATVRKMERLQNIDLVTNSPNQFKFEIDADNMIKYNRSTQYAIMYVNIINYKNIRHFLEEKDFNKMVKNLADIISRDITRNLEAYGRTSDGHMLVLMRYKKADEIRERFYEYLNKIKQAGPVSGYMMRINAGVYIVDRITSYTVSEMVDRAQFALDSIKESSDIIVEFYHKQSHDDLLKTVALEGFMERALENEEFIIHYQPKFDLTTNSIYGAEALVRWARPNEGIINPPMFISLFERSGYISQLDRFVFAEVCRFINRMVKQGKRIVPISVNVSRITAEKEGFIDYYVKTKKMYNIKDGFLEIEFTESRALEDYGLLKGIINQLKSNGFKCSIDDFGAGYSSFKALQALDFDIVKLDASLLKADMTRYKRGYRLLSGVIALANTLEMRVIAEGVETKQELEILKALKCDAIQGFLYARPMPTDDFIAFTDKALQQIGTELDV